MPPSQRKRRVDLPRRRSRNPRPTDSGRRTWTRPAADDPVCVDEVEALLDAHSQGGRVSRNTPPRLSPVTRSTSPASPNEPGTIIGRYKLLEQIGEGGFGDRLHGRAAGAGPPQGGAEDHQARHGHRAGDRPLRGRAAGAGPDGPPEHRQGPRRRGDRDRPALLRDGARAGHPDHRVLRPEQADDQRAAGALHRRLPVPSSMPIRRESSTATSSRPTCW